MKNVIRNLSIGFGLFIIIVCIGTCALHTSKPTRPPSTDTSYIEELHHRQQQLHIHYQKQYDALQHVKDSLSLQIKRHKQTLNSYRAKSERLEKQLMDLALRTDSAKALQDSISPLTMAYIHMQHERDSSCTQTIRALEFIGTKKDSVITIQCQEIETNRALQEQQRKQTELLTQQLNTAYKEQKRAVLKSKIGAGAMLILSGFINVLIINKSLK